jgi:hypothetical protein
LRLADPNSAVAKITEVQTARIEKAARSVPRKKGEKAEASVNRAIRKDVAEAKKFMSRDEIKIAEVEKFLNDILC